MYALRSNWHSVFRQALELLKASKHPIAKTTLEVIQNKEVHVAPYSQIKVRDYNQVYTKHKKKPIEFPLSPAAINMITEDCRGFIVKNRIYIQTVDNPKEFASVLVHEVNHFINDAENNYDTDEKKFTEEFRAEVAEALVFTPYLTRKNLKDIATDVANKNDLPMPTTPVEMPSGIFTRSQ